MRTTRLDINLAGFEVGLSGAVPDRKEWTEPAMDRAILEFVALLTGLVVKYGRRIIHGAHPTFTPAILRQAAQHSTSILRNELSEEENEKLFKTVDVAATVNIIFEQLASKPDLIQREFRNLIHTSSEFGNLVAETAEEPIRDDPNEPPTLLLN
jgi:hypothetical protein